MHWQSFNEPQIKHNENVVFFSEYQAISKDKKSSRRNKFSLHYEAYYTQNIAISISHNLRFHELPQQERHRMSGIFWKSNWS